MSLTGPQIDRIAKAIAAAYNRDELRRVLLVFIEEHFDKRVSDKAFGAQVFGLVEWASRQGRWLELLRCVYEYSRDYERLRHEWAGLGSGAQPATAAVYHLPQTSS